ncbi:IS110 family transposase [Mesorhizobium sp. M0136]|uniref:hypothetical protein n=1 Tax=Mesorhizobium sp. M0136 TaxID=2956890 RepID=UPI003337A7B6
MLKMTTGAGALRHLPGQDARLRPQAGILDSRELTDKGAKPIGKLSRPRVKTKQVNTPSFDVRAALYGVPGVDLTEIHGLGPSLKLIGECGTDLRAWPSAKHFTSWLCLAPGSKISGCRSICETDPLRNTCSRSTQSTADMIVMGGRLWQSPAARAALRRRDEMHSWEAIIAAVFGSLTGSEVAPMRINALPPGRVEVLAVEEVFKVGHGDINRVESLHTRLHV